MPTSKRVDQCINTITCIEFAPRCRIGTRNNFSKLKNPFCKTNKGQKAISYIGPSIWNYLSDSIKRVNSLNTFKHNVKKHKKHYLKALYGIYIHTYIYIYIYIYIRIYIHQRVIFVLQFSYIKHRKNYNFKFWVTPRFSLKYSMLWFAYRFTNF